ncbi:hypothetical protein D3C84_822900 [compost metagenome]
MRLRAVAVEHLATECGGHRRAIFHQSAGKGFSFFQKRFRRVNRAHQAAALSFLGVEYACGVDPLQSLLQADDTWQKPARAGFGDYA